MADAITLPAYDRTRLAQIETALRAELAGLDGGLVIADPITAQAIAEVLQLTLRELDAIEAERLSATKPLNQVKRTIDGWFKPAKDTGAALVGLLKAALAAWDQVQESQAREARALASAAVAMADVPLLTAALAVAAAPEIVAKPAEVGFRRTWVWRVVNLHLMPKEYLMPNAQALDAHLKGVAQDATPGAIPGVIFERETNVIGYR